MTRFVLSAALLVSCIALCRSAVAQTEDTSAGTPPPGEVGDVESEPIDLFRAPALYVRVLQDPMRIAPGESGSLILYVEGPPDGSTRIDRGGRARHKPTQGKLTLGAGRFEGSTSDKGSLRRQLVRIPIQVDPSATHGDLPVAGQVQLRSRTVTKERTGAWISRAIPWRGNIVCGRPVPRPKRRVARASSPDAAKGSAPRERSSETTRRANAGGASRPTPKPAHGDRDEASSNPDALAPDMPDSSTRDSRWIFLVIAGLGALLLLWSVRRRGPSARA